MLAFEECSSSIELTRKEVTLNVTSLPLNFWPIKAKLVLIHDDNIKWKHFHITGPLWGGSMGHLWIPLTKASDMELWCFLWSVPVLNSWANNQESGDLRHHHAHYDITVMLTKYFMHLVSASLGSNGVHEWLLHWCDLSCSWPYWGLGKMADFCRQLFRIQFLERKSLYLIQILMQFLHEDTVHNKSVLVEIMARCSLGHKPEPIVTQISEAYIDGLVQDCSISSANILEILQSCTKLLVCVSSQCSSQSKIRLLFHDQCGPQPAL